MPTAGTTGSPSQPGVVIWNRAILGCSISSAPVFLIDGERQDNKCGGVGFWQRQWAQDVVAFHPDAVVVMAGAWDLFDVATPVGTVLSPGQPAWTAAYDRDVALLFDTLRSTGAPVVAVDPSCYGHNELPGTDPQSPERLDATRVAAVHQVWADEAQAHGASLAPLDGLLCPGGTSDPSIRPNGAHFGTAGADRAAPRWWCRPCTTRWTSRRRCQSSERTPRRPNHASSATHGASCSGSCGPSGSVSA